MTTAERGTGQLKEVGTTGQRVQGRVQRAAEGHGSLWNLWSILGAKSYKTFFLLFNNAATAYAELLVPLKFCFADVPGSCIIKLFTAVINYVVY